MTSPLETPSGKRIQSALRASIFIGISVAFMSYAGLLFEATVYPHPDLASAFAANDVVNLLFVLPALMLGIVLRRRMIFYFLWAAALMCIAYNGLVATLSFAFGWQLVVYFMITVLSAANVFRLLARVEAFTLVARVSGAVSEIWAGGALVLFGLAFLARAALAVPGAIAADPPSPQTDFALHITDFVFSLVWIGVGIGLLQLKQRAYVLAAASLLQIIILFAALLLVLFLKPFTENSPLPVTDIAITGVMMVVFSVPATLFLRGLVRTT